ncbi:protein kinase [Spongiactinospora sp. TRM90649]|uniref:WD40 repeat domain-containing serine/threonine protein kinase n=1 Tax=Spongiactinospora sp. TRM90649 TaxID=3031114 RepID=UPI0023F7E75C|nr:protein kinase [Spongiactinospora sp. TRM90649]MDF5757674.1 protein kinase [Spongiactinospora sp. TRM90649]
MDERIGQYWLAGRLGEGGQGVVYEAYDSSGGRVALKALHTTGDPALRERLAREASAARRVASFCTARVLDVETDGPRPFIVTEYVPGPSLRRAVREGRSFEGDDLHRLATAVATALAAIHEAGVVHRDLKPDNVLLGPDGPRVIDFGISRTDEMSLSSTGVVVGTPAYMAPEAFNGHRAGAPADVFAWGAVVLFASLGHDVFRGGNTGAVIHQVLTATPDLGHLTPALRPLVAAALTKEPQARPTARELLLALVSGHGEAGLLSAGGDRAGQMRQDAHRDPGLGAIAEEAYTALSEAERALVPGVFLRLVAVGDDGAETPVPADSSRLGNGPQVERILRVFSYVISERDGKVVLSRPAVLRAWPRLRTWVDAERGGLPLAAELAGAAAHWGRHGHRDGDLLRGSRLESARRWAAEERRHITLTSLENDFLAASDRAEIRAGRVRRAAVITLVTLLVVALVGAGAAVLYASRADRERVAADAAKRQALSRQLALRSASLAEVDPGAAQLLAVTAWEYAHTPEARYGLRNALAQPARYAAPRSVSSVAYSPDGRTLAVGTDEGPVELWDAATHRRIRVLTGAPGAVTSVTFSPDGRLVAAASTDVRLWDAANGQPNGEPLPGDTAVAFSHNGKRIATGGTRTRLWNVASRRQVGDSLPRADAIVFTRDGELFATVHAADANTRLFDAATREQVALLPTGRASTTPALAFGGGLLAVSTKDLTLWDVAARRPVGGPLPGGGAVAFAPGETTLAVSVDGDVRLVDVAARRAAGRPLAGPEFRAQQLAFSPADGTLAAPGLDELRIWDPAVHRQRGTPYSLDDHNGLEVAYAPDGRTLLGTAEDAVRLWETSSGKTLARLKARGNNGVTASSALSPDGTLLAVVSGGRIDWWDAVRRRYVDGTDLPGDLAPYRTVFSPDGTLLATAASDVRLWDARTRRQVGRAIPVEATEDLLFTPDGKRLATVGRENGLQLWDTATQARTGAAVPGVQSAAFSPDGRLLAVGGTTGRVLDAATRRQIGQPFARASRVVFDPGGNVLATADTGGEVRLWDVATQLRLGPALSGHTAEVRDVAFAPGGGLLVTASMDDTVRVWTLPVAAERPDDMADALCDLAGRTLTRQEWERYVPGEPYHSPCAA